MFSRLTNQLGCRKFSRSWCCSQAHTKTHPHTHTIHSHQAPHPPSFSPVLSPSPASLCSLYTPTPYPSAPPTGTSPAKMHSVLRSRNPPLSQTRTENGACYCWQCACLICCRGGNRDSRTLRRHVHGHPQIGRASVAECVLSGLSLSLLLSLSVFICVCFLSVSLC